MGVLIEPGLSDREIREYRRDETVVRRERWGRGPVTGLCWKVRVPRCDLWVELRPPEGLARETRHPLCAPNSARRSGVRRQGRGLIVGLVSMEDRPDAA